LPPHPAFENPSGKLIESFRDALVVAFPNSEAFSRFVEDADLVKNLEAEVGRGPLKQVVREFLKFEEARGQLGTVLDKALEHNPGNPQLLQLAKSVGRKAIPGGYEGLSVASFDLRRQENAWREALGAALTKRVIVFVIRETVQEVLEPLTKRLHRFLGELFGTEASGPTNVTLRATLSNLEEAIGRVVKVAPLRSSKPALINVFAENAQAHIVSAFLEGVCQKFATGLAEHLVLVINVAHSWPAAPDHVELPAWCYEDAELNLWINGIARRAGWPQDLMLKVKDFICANATYGGQPTPGGLYDTLAGVIDFLRGEPSEDELIDWLAANLIR
jgi:hypothetical protein